MGDEVECLKPTAARLARPSVNGTAVASGEDPVRGVGGGASQCAVVHVKMAGMAGLELLCRITGEVTPVPVIFLASHASLELRVNRMEPGVFEHVLKPLEFGVLRDTVRRAARVRCG